MLCDTVLRALREVWTLRQASLGTVKMRPWGWGGVGYRKTTDRSPGEKFDSLKALLKIPFPGPQVSGN